MRASGHGPWDTAPTVDRRLWAEAEPAPFWLDSPSRPAASPPLEGETECDLAIVGGGLSGLWAAVLASEREPGREIALIDADRIGHAASGRNGGFMVSSLTHGIANGVARFPEEVGALERLGLQNFEATVATIEREAIDCDLELGGSLDVAVEPHEVEWLTEQADALRRFGHEAEVLDREQVRGAVASPLYQAGCWQRTGAALIDPAKLCWGLARVARERGVRVCERSPVSGLRERGEGSSCGPSVARFAPGRCCSPRARTPG